MDWSIFALAQMFIITVGASLAFYMRFRGMRNQNQQLREALDSHVEAAEADTGPSATEWLQERIDALPPETASTPTIRLVLEQILTETDNFEASLVDTITATGLVSSGADENVDRIAELETELANALNGNANEEAETRNAELKSLLQQFTKDSRAMMACIQSLESDNEELRGLLEAENPDAAKAFAADQAAKQELAAKAEAEAEEAA